MGVVIVVGLGLAIAIVVAAVKYPAASSRAAASLRAGAGVVALLVLAASVVMSSVRYVGGDFAGIVIKNIAVKDLPQGQIIATQGEKGPQAKILGPGWKFGYWPVIYDVEKARVIEIKEGQVGLITTTDGRPLPLGEIYAPEWSQDEFQKMLDADHFLTSGKGYKGPQASVLTPGKYRLNTRLFTIDPVTVTNIEQATVGFQLFFTR